MDMVFVVLALVLLVLVGGAALYNQLIARKQMVSNGWSDIDVQLRRRSDLIPRMVETVKGYAAHELNLFTEITEKRAIAAARARAWPSRRSRPS